MTYISTVPFVTGTISVRTDPALPRPWRAWVNKPQTEAEVATIRHCIQRDTHYGSDRWGRSAARHGVGKPSALQPARNGEWYIFAGEMDKPGK